MQVRSFYVKPNIPEKLLPLREIAYNLWFSWNWEAVELFIRLGGNYWNQSYQNPARLIGMVPQERYERLATDDSFVASVDSVYKKFKAYMSDQGTWFRKRFSDLNGTIAYFSMEYGLDEGLPVYSGGLGMLSGDHMKSASDLNLPLVGVGLLYRQGYFRQYLNADGWQQEEYPENDWYTMPVTRVEHEDGTPLMIEVEFPDALIKSQVWRVDVGRVQMYLLDTNIPENPPEHRVVTAQLYGGDRDMRIRQEVLMGVGGMRALKALGITPAVCHMNEGHSAFLAIERLRMIMEENKCDLASARELIWASSVFTTHTPVVAGNERFDPALVRKYMEPLGNSIGLGWDQFLALGRERPEDTTEAFCMTVLAIKLSAHCNAVAKLHGVVSRDMWKNTFPQLPVDEVPIGHVTNGVHIRGWLSHDLADLYERYIGPRFETDPMDFNLFDRIEGIPDIEVWRTHERRRERLVNFTRDRLRSRMTRRGAGASEIRSADEVLDPRAFTIGFARRFATYKRSTLLFRDPERLARLLNNEKYPMQLIFAGKAHPHDNPGKELIKHIVHMSRDPRFRNKIVFLEDYDAAVARYLTQGCDIWLNTPKRPLEASGTSGMKAACNGVLNCSILDGWWDEGYSPEVGFAIGSGEEYDDDNLQNHVESTALYDLLEREIAPSFYDRGRDGLPREWIRKMKASMKILGRFFNTSRMVAEYTDKYYAEAMRKNAHLGANGLSGAKALSDWRARVQAKWHEITIEAVDPSSVRDISTVVGTCLNVKARVRLGSLTPDDVQVELFHGSLSSKGEIVSGERTTMTPNGNGDGVTTFQGCIPCKMSGRYGYAVRILPKHADLVHPYDGKCLLWG
jgi:starch phosphorylase